MRRIGPGINADDGRVVSSFIDQALRGEAITVLGDGSQTRSFCFYLDLVDGLHRLMNSAGDGRPVRFDHLSDGHAEFVKCGDLIEDDIASALARVQPVAAIHFAAHAYAGESMTDPAKYYDDNVTGSLNVARGLRDHCGIGRVLKPGGLAFLTVSDKSHWNALHDQQDASGFSLAKRIGDSAPEFAPELQNELGSQNHYYNYSDVGPDRSAIFTPQAHLRSVWARFIDIEEIISFGHARQTMVVLKN